MTEEHARYEEYLQREFAERFTSALQTWRFEVDSHWTRTSYFSLFQAGAFVALWTLMTSAHLFTSVFLSILGLILSVVWLANDILMHAYIKAWWARSRDIEKEFQVKAQRQLVWHFNKRRIKCTFLPKYRYISRSVPIVFISAWVWVLVWNCNLLRLGMFLVRCK